MWHAILLQFVWPGFMRSASLVPERWIAQITANGSD